MGTDTQGALAAYFALRAVQGPYRTNTIIAAQTDLRQRLRASSPPRPPVPLRPIPGGRAS